MAHSVDKLDLKILRMISNNARISFLEVARECGMSGAAIHQRVQKLVDNGIIKGSEFSVDLGKIGYETCAFIGITVPYLSHYDSVVAALKEIPEVVECHTITGRFTLLVKIYAHNNRHLLSVLSEKIESIEGVSNVETCFISLDEVFTRPMMAFE